MARGAPPPIIFERQILPQQTIYRWKGNLTASRIHLKYWKNILISRFYEQFSRNGSAMAPERLFKKFQTYKIWTYYISSWSTWSGDFEYIITFAKIWAKTDFAKFLEVFIKSRNLKFRESNYTFEISRPRALKWYITCSYFKSLKFFEQPFRSHCGAISRKLLIKSRNQNIFPIFKINPVRC